MMSTMPEPSSQPSPPAPPRRPVGFAIAIAIAVLIIAGVALLIYKNTGVNPSNKQGDFAGADDAFASDATDIRQTVRGAQGLHIQMMDRDDRNRLAAELHSDTIDPIRAQRYKVTNPKAIMYLKDGRTLVVTSDSGTLLMPDRSQAPEAGTLTGHVRLRLFDPLPASTTDDSSNRRIDPDSDTPSLTWQGETLTFDATLGEASTSKPFTLSSDRFVFKANDAKLLINQTLERLERFTVRTGGSIVYHQSPTALPTASGTPSPATPDTNQSEPSGSIAQATPARDAQSEADASDQTTNPQPHEPIITHYQAAFRDGIVLALNDQHIESDRLDLFARTIDNKIPEDAITQVNFDDSTADTGNTKSVTPPPHSPDTNTPVQDATSNPDQSDEQNPPPSSDTPDAPVPHTPTTDDVVLTWTGPLDVRPLASEPTELKNDHILARFSSEQTGIVHFADNITQARGQAAIVEYGMTSQLLVLTGPAQENVMLTSPDMGQSRMGRLEFSLATGLAHVPGPGSLIAAHNKGRVDWREQADLTFALNEGRITSQLLEAVCQGGAKATNNGSTIEAEQLHAYFDPNTPDKANLTRLIATTNITLSDAKGKGGSCDRLDVALHQVDNKPQPKTIDASGHVDFHEPGTRIVSDHLYAILRPTPSNPTDLQRIWAEGNIDFRRNKDNIRIKGQQLFADADRKFLEVKAALPHSPEADTQTQIFQPDANPTGDALAQRITIDPATDHATNTDAADKSDPSTPTNPPAFASVTRHNSTITGEHIRLHGVERTVEVFGAGSFHHASGKGPTRSSINASWTQGMAYDDIAGTLQCMGHIQAINQADAYSRDAISAQLLQLWLDPAPAPGQPSSSDDQTQLADGQNPSNPLDDELVSPLDTRSDRAIRKVIITSAAFLDPALDQLAQIESSRYAAPIDSPDPKLIEAMRLTGVQIIADNTAGTLDVHGRGSLLLADLRAQPDQLALDATTTSLNPDNRGSALFQWADTFHANRTRGTASMLGHVHMTHATVPTNTNSVSKTNLDCQDLAIRFAPDIADPSASGNTSALGGLRGVVAKDQVYFRNDNRELTCDQLHYEPDIGLAKAIANDFNQIQILDLSTGSPINASAIIWNLTTDQVDIVDPSTITMPSFD